MLTLFVWCCLIGSVCLCICLVWRLIWLLDFVVFGVVVYYVWVGCLFAVC